MSQHETQAVEFTPARIASRLRAIADALSVPNLADVGVSLSVTIHAAETSFPKRAETADRVAAQLGLTPMTIGSDGAGYVRWAQTDDPDVQLTVRGQIDEATAHAHGTGES